MKFAALLLAGTALLASTSANATLTVYTSQSAFLSAVTAPGVDTYTGLSITGSTPSPLTRTAGAYGYTASVSTTSFFGAGTTANPWLSTNTATDSITFSGFSPLVQAIGGNFFGSDITGAFALGNISISATDANGTITQTIVNAQTTSFLGFVSTGGLSSLVVSAVQPATPLWPTVDNLTLAQVPSATPAVPEPASWAMMILGMGAVGYAMRRRSKVSTTVRFA